MPLRGKQPHERVCVANWRRSLCAAKRPRTPAGVNGCSVGAAYMPPAAYRGNPSTGKGEGCRPPLPLSSATHLWQSVGAGHARPAALLCHPFAFCIVGRGLDPSAASRRREPQSPSGHRCRSATSPVRGGSSRGLRPRKKAPLTGELAAPAGLRGFAGLSAAAPSPLCRPIHSSLLSPLSSLFSPNSASSLSQNFTNFTLPTQNLPPLCKTFTAIVPYHGRNRRKTAVQLACFR